MAEEVVLKETRKTFIPGYMLMASLAAMPFVLKIKGFDIGRTTLIFIAGIVGIGLFIPEIVRAWSESIVTKDQVITKTGIITKMERKVFVNTVTDVHIEQNLWQRLWNYGTLIIRSFAPGGEMRLGHISNPRKKVVEIEKVLAKRISANPE